ncbi:polysaccharide biosynthesis protein [Alicyclobacillus sp. SO9]|uniref:polysaccharide biosynthesis protein n=1 Tax=Alicyclobacillus sp. SO9 TaxID=2665646 RepID=UPI0018E8E2B4|nr:polysaccharide biosynthesis protein [Alicyclobacillus sp. SO9]QQE80321.1 polysaccharide biosynthesis protein [Alicyclobacillus sp. SO9]
MFENATCLITGGTGSWGHELTRKLLSFHPKEIRILSRNEFAQVQMQRRFQANPILHFVVGDVRDREAVEAACKNVDYVFHLAALKHVPICEYQPEEALKTNLQGTQNVIRASVAAGVRKVIDVSTDKAVDPVNFYGMTKALGEKLMIHANDESTRTRFVCIRGGNVLGTNGSVVPFFKNQILANRRVSLTHRDMTRFFLTVGDAIELLTKAANLAVGGETFVMKMKKCSILDLAQVMGESLSDKGIEIQETGIRPGEKLHEVLVSRNEASRTYKFGEEYFVILPSHPSEMLQRAYQSLEPVEFTQYDSSTNLMAKPSIRSMLTEGGFLP